MQLQIYYKLIVDRVASYSRATDLEEENRFPSAFTLKRDSSRSVFL